MDISIITVNYNNASGLKKTMASVFEQEYLPYEYIIIDGGSTDGSVKYIEEYSDKISYWISEKDRGIYHAMNKGISQATGEFLIFLNSGDSFCASTTLGTCIDFVMSSPGTDIFYADIYHVTTENSLKKLWSHPSKLSLKFLRIENINHQASLFRSSLFTEFGFYPEDYKLASDFWMYLQCLLSNKQFTHMPFPMINYDLSGLSLVQVTIYREEKKQIWQSLVPWWLQDLIDENDVLTSENMKNKEIISYKLVNGAITINSFFQKVRRFF